MSRLQQKMLGLPDPEPVQANVVISDDMLSALSEFDQQYSFDTMAYARKAFGVKVSESDDVC